MRVQFEIFQGGPLSTWESIAANAAAFAAKIGPKRLINISHSADNSNGIVIVWYWSEPAEDRKTYG